MSVVSAPNLSTVVLHSISDSDQVVLCRISHNPGEANPCEIIGIIRDDDVCEPMTRT